MKKRLLFLLFTLSPLFTFAQWLPVTMSFQGANPGVNSKDSIRYNYSPGKVGGASYFYNAEYIRTNFEKLSNKVTTLVGANNNTYPTSLTVANAIAAAGGVNSVLGTTNRITTSPTTGNVVVDISASYVGQSSITTLGTIGTGVWQGTAIEDAYIASSGNWNTAYTNRITSLTTTGSSGPATLSSNVLNVPQYTIAGLGGEAVSNKVTTLDSSATHYPATSAIKVIFAGSRVNVTAGASNPVTVSSYQATYAALYGNHPTVKFFEKLSATQYRHRTDIQPLFNYSSGLLNTIQLDIGLVPDGYILITP